MYNQEKLMVKISIQEADFNLSEEVNLLEKLNNEDGAVVTFSGRVRNVNLDKSVSGLFLEHYPGMTEKSLEKIIEQAKQQWTIGRVTIIHRIGQLLVGDQIVFVGVTSKHRKEAFAACEFIMDYLKVEAPFWKKELSDGEESWLDAKQSDKDKAKNWQS
ncbi:MAG: molybdopterin synthase catalytic subunit MoaE [Colwelliaceae bacterium]|jgi:molybdopterin synthase catalytic subunit|nr:molybdopterin synthase catalytic subunit MoaE [Colwelliaceae bacterium]